jgi:hypothetical protein
MDSGPTELALASNMDMCRKVFETQPLVTELCRRILSRNAA